MDWKKLNYAALIAIIFGVIMFVTLVLPNVADVVTIAFGFGSVTAAVLSLRE